MLPIEKVKKKWLFVLLGVVYILIYNIAKKAGQIEKKGQKNRPNKEKESKIKVISTEDVSTDNSTGKNICNPTSQQNLHITLLLT